MTDKQVKGCWDGYCEIAGRDGAIEAWGINAFGAWLDKKGGVETQLVQVQHEV